MPFLNYRFFQLLLLFIPFVFPFLSFLFLLHFFFFSNAAGQITRSSSIMPSSETRQCRVSCHEARSQE